MSGVRNMRGALDSVHRVNKAIRAMPTSLEAMDKAASNVATHLDGLVKAEFAAGLTVYDEPRPLGTHGNALSLVSTPTPFKYTNSKSHHRAPGKPQSRRKSPGARREKVGMHVCDTIGFVSVGTIVRASLPQRYARYLIGKYRILPQIIPPPWVPGIKRAIGNALTDYLVQAGAVAR